MPLPTPAEMRDRTKTNAQMREMMAQIAESALAKPINIVSATDLNTMSDNSAYYVVPETATLASIENKPENTRFHLHVEKINNWLVRHVAETETNNIYHRVGSGAANNRTWTTWKKVEYKDEAKASLDAEIKNNVFHCEWFATANNVTPYFDASTKTLSWSVAVMCPSRLSSVGFLLLYAGSVVCDVDLIPNGVLFIDLDKVPANGAITSDLFSTCLVYANYTTYKGNPRYIPIAKQDKTRNNGKALVAVNGFVTISNSFELKGKAHHVLEWQKTSATAAVKFNTDTKKLEISGLLLAAYPNTAGRIRIGDLNITFSNNYEVAYIDLETLGNVSNIDAANASQYIKIATYSSAQPFVAKESQVPLVKFFTDGSVSKVEPASGFVDITTYNSTTLNIEKDNGFIDFDKTETLLQVYLKTSHGNDLKVSLQHQIIPFNETSNVQSNADLWRLYRVTECNPTTKFPLLNLVNEGEWELAILHEENTQAAGVAKDHVGGFHGDEILTDAKFFVDGVLKPQDFIVSGIKKAKKIEFIQHSVVYFQGTSRPLCSHVKHITFSKDGIALKQKIDFKYEAVVLTTAWFTMLPVLRLSLDTQVTDKSSRSIDWFAQEDDNSVTGFGRRYTPVQDGSIIKQWCASTGYSFETNLIKVPNFNSNQNAFISSDAAYNKLYLSAIGSSDTGSSALVPLNTIWETESKFVFDKSLL